MGTITPLNPLACFSQAFCNPAESFQDLQCKFRHWGLGFRGRSLEGLGFLEECALIKTYAHPRICQKNPNVCSQDLRSLAAFCNMGADNSKHKLLQGGEILLEARILTPKPQTPQTLNTTR